MGSSSNKHKYHYLTQSQRTRRELTPVVENASAARNSKTPPIVTVEPIKEDPAVHSGSEEGEIEEE